MELNSFIKKQTHLVQSEQWNLFKKNYGTKVQNFENIYFLEKNIPFTNYKMGYAPKVNFNIQIIDFKRLKEFARKNKYAFIRFDVPNILLNNNEKWENKLSKVCKRAPRNTFTKKNIYLDLQPNIEDLTKKFHQKKRYNIKQAQKRGVEVKVEQNNKAFENFWRLHKLTAKNQGFLIHSKEYFEDVFKTFKNNVYFVQGFVGSSVASCWMIIYNNKTIYYIYGGSNPKYNNFYPNDLVGFKAIELGKALGATAFDMWGAEEGKGFTDFKLKYGATLVEYIGSYDLVINKFSYLWFNFTYEGFWKLVNLKKKIFK